MYGLIRCGCILLRVFILNFLEGELSPFPHNGRGQQTMGFGRFWLAVVCVGGGLMLRVMPSHLLNTEGEFTHLQIKFLYYKTRFWKVIGLFLHVYFKCKHQIICSIFQDYNNIARNKVD